MKLGLGYDQNFVLKGEDSDELVLAARAKPTTKGVGFAWSPGTIRTRSISLELPAKSVNVITVTP